MLNDEHGAVCAMRQYYTDLAYPAVRKLVTETDLIVCQYTVRRRQYDRLARAIAEPLDLISQFYCSLQPGNHCGGVQIQTVRAAFTAKRLF